MNRRIIQALGPVRPLGVIAPMMTTNQWTAATVSSTGVPSLNNTIEDGFRMSISSSGTTAALIRQYSAMTFNRNWLPGKNSEIDWSKPFRVRIPIRCTIGGVGTGFKFTVFIGGLSAAPTVHTMSGKGLALCIIGTGANAGTVQLGAHNGSAQVDCTAVPETFDGSLRHIDVLYLPGTGAILSVGGSLIGTVASAALPTGTSSSACGWAVLMEHTTATNGVSIVNLPHFTIEFLSP